MWLNCSQCATKVGKLVSHDKTVLQAFEGSFRRERERWTGKETGCKKVEDRRLRSGEEKRCSPDSFKVWAFVALG